MRISKHFFLVLLGFALVAPTLAPLPVRAEEIEDGRAPLMTIRFNQSRVYFDQQLYSAVSKALEAKPDVMFDVVAFAPFSGNVPTDRQWQRTAGRNVKSVISAMNQMGVPLERINVVGRHAPGLAYDETRLYVR